MKFTDHFDELNPNIDTVEEMLVWCLQALAFRSPAAVELSNTSGPIAPITMRVSRSPSGPNYGKPFLEFGGYISLDADTVHSIPLYKTAKEFNELDFITLLPHQFRN